MSGFVKKRGMLLFYILIAVVTAAFIAKVFLCDDVLSFVDESSMFATAYRFYQGDAILVDEWSAPQLFGVVLLPLFSIFRFFSHSNDGLFLFMRLNYIGLKLFVLIYGIKKAEHMRLKRFNVYAGLLLWYIFSTMCVETLTYQTVPPALLMFVLIGAIADNTTKAEYFLMGMAYALSVLSQVFFVFSYPVLLIILFVYHKKTGRSNRSAIFFHLGILTVFLWFLYLLFSRASMHDIIVNLPYVLSEPDHDVSEMSFFSLIFSNGIRRFGGVMIKGCSTIVLFVNILLLFIISVAFIAKWKRREMLKTLIPISLLISMLAMALETFEKGDPTMNMMFAPFIWASVEVMFFVRDRRYPAYWVMSYMYVAGVALGTNTGGIATSGALILVAIVFIFFWPGAEADHREEDIPEVRRINEIMKALSCTAFPAAVTCAVFLTLFFKFYLDPWSRPHEPYSSFTNRITVGPMKGLYTTDGLYEIYMDIWDDVESIEKTEDDLLFCGNAINMAFLDAEVRYGTMGTMFFYLDFDRAKDYWRLHPDRIPTIIYCNDFADDDVNRLMSILRAEDYDIRREDMKLIAIRK